MWLAVPGSQDGPVSGTRMAGTAQAVYEMDSNIALSQPDLKTSKSLNNKRLRNLRQAAGLSLDALSTRIEHLVTAQAIGKYERGEARPSPGVLFALGGALGVSARYLSKTEPFSVEAVEFRTKSAKSQREMAAIEARLREHLGAYLEVERVLNLPSVEWDRPRGAPYPVTVDVSDADRAAVNLRAHWGLGSEPILNLAELIEEHGIKVLSVELAKDDGLLARIRHGNGVSPVIVVNRTKPGERQRFTMGHELGHLVMQVASRVDTEKAAHQFAEAFLMPADALWAEIGRHRQSIGGKELFDLKRRFGVSVQALTYRCRHLGIFSERLARDLLGVFADLGWSRPPYAEPGELPPETPTRFRRLTLRAFAEQALSESDAAAILGWSVPNLRFHMEIKQTSSVGPEVPIENS